MQETILSTFLSTGDAATHPGTGSVRTVRRPAAPLQELYLQPPQKVATGQWGIE